MLVGVLHDLGGELDVLLHGVVGAVDHHRGEARVHAGLAQLEGVAVVEVEGEVDVALHALDELPGPLGQVAEERLVGVLAGPRADLEDEGRLRLDAAADDGLELLQVVEVVRGDGVLAFHGLLEHLPRVDDSDVLVRDRHEVSFFRVFRWADEATPARTSPTGWADR